MRKIENRSIENVNGGWMPTGLDGLFWLSRDEIDNLERRRFIVENLDHIMYEKPENKSYCLVWMRDYTNPSGRKEYEKHDITPDEMEELLGEMEHLSDGWDF